MLVNIHQIKIAFCLKVWKKYYVNWSFSSESLLNMQLHHTIQKKVYKKYWEVKKSISRGHNKRVKNRKYSFFCPSNVVEVLEITQKFLLYTLVMKKKKTSSNELFFYLLSFLLTEIISWQHTEIQVMWVEENARALHDANRPLGRLLGRPDPLLLGSVSSQWMPMR